ncbi:acetylornithine deacetylase [Neobacillus sp. Marseille-QA0830]
MDEQLVKKMAEEVDARQEELFGLLSQLVSFPTVSPPARNTNEIQGFVKEYLEDLGFQTDQWEVYPGDSNVVGTLRGTASEQYNSLIINGHVDVALVGDEKEWISSPFQTVIQDQYVYGRGTADMKGGIAASLYAIKLLKELGVPLQGDLQFQSVIGEEVGEAGTLACLERGYGADYAVVVDTSDLHIQGQGGVITGWITIESPKTFHDGLRRQLIHAGGGINGASAIEKMMKVIAGLQELERHWAITKSFPGFPPGTNTINPAVIEGGRHAAFIADRCALWVTVHFYPNEDYEQVTKEIEQHIDAVAAADPWLKENPPKFVWGGKSMIVDRGEIFPSLELQVDHPGTRALADSFERTLSHKPVIGMSTSVNDSGWLGRAGIPTATFGPGKLEDAHAVDEKVEIKQLLDFTKALAVFITEWCNTRKEEKIG